MQRTTHMATVATTTKMLDVPVHIQPASKHIRQEACFKYMLGMFTWR